MDKAFSPTVDVTYRRADIVRAALSLYARRSWPYWLLCLGIIALLNPLWPLWPWPRVGDGVDWLGGLLVAIALLWPPLGSLAVILGAFRSWRTHEDLHAESRFTLNGKYLTLAVRGERNGREWSDAEQVQRASVKELQTGSRAILIVRRDGRYHLIPRRCFASPEAADAWAEALKRWLDG